MRSKHLQRRWEYSRFWQKERESGSRIPPPSEFDDLPDIEWPEHLRMPVTRGETNRFRRGLQKTLVSSRRRKGIPAHLVFARLNRKLTAMEKEQDATNSD